MIRPCPDPIELAALLDRELPERRADELRGHVETCSLCTARAHAHAQTIADLRAPAVEVAVAPLAARIMAGLDHAARPSRRAPRWTWIGGLALAAAAATVVVVTLRPSGDRETMQARGGGGDALSRRASASLYVVGDRTEPARAGASLPADAHFVLGYRNLERSPVYLTAFAEDATHTLHWLYPAYERASDHPEAIVLPIADRETLLPETVVLDQPALGPLRVVTVISRARPSVATIEALAPADRSVAALSAHWPEAVVTETVVTLRGSAP